MSKRRNLIGVIAILVICMVMTAFAGCAAEPVDEAAGIFEYELTDEGVTITRYIGTDAVVNVPETLNGYTVLYIGDGAFKDLEFITEINLPVYVKSIGACAFMNCTSIKKMEICDTVTVMGERAFEGCTSLEYITLPYEILYNGENFKIGFCGAENLKSVRIPNGVTAIDNNAFFECKSLEYVYMPDSVVSIGDFAFKGCSLLSETKMPESLESVGEGAFQFCYAMGEIHFPEKLNFIGENAFFGSNIDVYAYKHPRELGYEGDHLDGIRNWDTIGN